MFVPVPLSCGDWPKQLPTITAIVYNCLVEILSESTGRFAGTRQHILFTHWIQAAVMPECDQCETETINPATIINDKMQRLCQECKQDATESSERQSESNGEANDQSQAVVQTTAGTVQQASEWNVQSIREDWQALNVRLPDHLMRRFQAYHKRLDYELVPKDIDFGKDRHYKPLVIALGLRAVREMDADDTAQALELLQANQLVDD